MPTTSSRVSAGAPVRSSRSRRQHLEGDLEQRGGEVGHRRAEGLEGQGAGEVGHGDPEQLASAGWCARRAPREAGSSLRPAADRIRRSTSSRERGMQPGGVAEELHALRGLLEQVGGEPAAGQGVRQTLGRRPLVAQQPAGTSASSRARR